MHFTGRKLFPYFALLLCVAALGWAVSFGTLPPADFTFNNGTEIKTVDPAMATGQPEGRILNALFEGLYRMLPEEQDPTSLKPRPAVAESYTLSADEKTYTFKIRSSAHWSDGTPVTAHDFVFSWRRMLHPGLGSDYAGLLADNVVGAGKYHSSKVELGDKVEVELDDRPDANQLFPRGTILSGVLKELIEPEKPDFEIPAGSSQEVIDEKKDIEAKWRRRWTFVVEVKPTSADGAVDWAATGKVRRFSKDPAEGVEKCEQTLFHFDEEVAIKAPDDHTLVMTLKNRTPYFLDLVAFYPLYPVNRKCVETHGSPNWTRAENIVSNGPYTLKFRRIRDRVRMVKNPEYWDADNVQLEIIDAMAVKSSTTNLNMYLNGQIDWATTVPSAMIPELQGRDDFNSSPMLTIYMYRLNVNHEALRDVRVRRALNMAIDKKQICEKIAKAGQIPARNFVPPGLIGYEPAYCGEHNVKEAQRLLADAGYPGGKGFPTLDILYNTSDDHRDIAQVIGRQWKENLGIDVDLRNLEWGVFLNELSNRAYQVARSGWIGDYLDPNTFLDMWVTDGPNNQTNWSNKKYDQLIADAKTEQDPTKRMKIMHDAERILMDEIPVIPIYFQVSKNMVRSYVKGFHPNLQDVHPLHLLRIDPEEKRRVLSAEGIK